MTTPGLPVVGPRPVTELPVEVRRSARRRRTVSAFRDGDRLIVQVPARLTAAEERQWVEKMVTRLAVKEQRGPRSDDELHRRAVDLSATYLAAAARPRSIRWVDNQHKRWGSCSTDEGTIRISSVLRGMPDYVVDAVILHELVHLLHPHHDAAFWATLRRYPQLDKAQGFLDGFATAARWGIRPGPAQDHDDVDPQDEIADAAGVRRLSPVGLSAEPGDGAGDKLW